MLNQTRMQLTGSNIQYVTTRVTCDHDYWYVGTDVPTDHADELPCHAQRASATQALQVWEIFCSDVELNCRGCD